MRQFSIFYIQELRPQQSRFLYLLSHLYSKYPDRWWTIEALCYQMKTLNMKSIQNKSKKWSEEGKIRRQYNSDSGILEYQIAPKGITWASRVPTTLKKQYEKEVIDTNLDHIEAQVQLQARGYPFVG